MPLFPPTAVVCGYADSSLTQAIRTSVKMVCHIGKGNTIIGPHTVLSSDTKEVRSFVLVASRLFTIDNCSETLACFTSAQDRLIELALRPVHSQESLS